MFELHDYAGQGWLFFNIVDFGTDFQICRLLCKGPGVPKSKLCAQAFMEAWVSWAGWPKDVRVDRGLRNRGYLKADASAAAPGGGAVGRVSRICALLERNGLRHPLAT